MKKKKIIRTSFIILTMVTTAVLAFSYSFDKRVALTTHAHHQQMKKQVNVQQKLNEIERLGNHVVSGIVSAIYENEIWIVDSEGKTYQLYVFSEEDKKADITVGSQMKVEGEIVSQEEVRSFEFFSLYFPEDLSDVDRKKIEELYHEAIGFEAEELWQEAETRWKEMYYIIDSYLIATWEPASFEEYISVYELPFSIEDLTLLEDYYQNWISLRKVGEFQKADEQMEEFYSVINRYFQMVDHQEGFVALIEELPFELKEEDARELERLYLLATSYEKAADWDKASKVWEEFDQLLSPYFLPEQQLSFEEYVMQLGLELAIFDRETIKPLYEEAVRLEEQGERELAKQSWAEIDDLLTPYYEALLPIPFKVKAILVNK